MPTLVSLSSGETFYVDAEPHEINLKAKGLTQIGARHVNGGQVAQLQPVPEIPSIHLPGEQINRKDDDGSG